VLRKRLVHQNRHEYAVARLIRIVDEHLELTGTSGGVFGSNTKYRVRARRGITPDLSVVLGPRLDSIDPNAAYNTLGPDLAVEILSPGQGEEYIEERLDDYLKLGTAEVWAVDPWAGTVIGYALRASKYEVFAHAEGVGEFHSQLLPELSFSVGRLWMRQG
jgi:Uma2 family endonuclease